MPLTIRDANGATILIDPLTGQVITPDRMRSAAFAVAQQRGMDPNDFVAQVNAVNGFNPGAFGEDPTTTLMQMADMVAGGRVLTGGPNGPGSEPEVDPGRVLTGGPTEPAPPWKVKDTSPGGIKNVFVSPLNGKVVVEYKDAIAYPPDEITVQQFASVYPRARFDKNGRLAAWNDDDDDAVPASTIATNQAAMERQREAQRFQAGQSALLRQDEQRRWQESYDFDKAKYNAGLEVAHAREQQRIAESTRDFKAAEYWRSRGDELDRMRFSEDRRRFDASLEHRKGQDLLNLGTRPETFLKYLYALRGLQSPQGLDVSPAVLPGFGSQAAAPAAAASSTPAPTVPSGGGAPALPGSAPSASGTGLPAMAAAAPAPAPAPVGNGMGAIALQDLLARQQGLPVPARAGLPQGTNIAGPTSPVPSMPLQNVLVPQPSVFKIGNTEVLAKDAQPAGAISVNAGQILPGTVARIPMPQNWSTNPAATVTSIDVTPDGDVVEHGMREVIQPQHLGGGTRWEAYADGGPIREPVIGRGVISGLPYMFGEDGTEHVVPEGKTLDDVKGKRPKSRKYATGGAVGGVPQYARSVFNPAGLAAKLRKSELSPGVPVLPQFRYLTGQGESLIPGAQQLTGSTPSEQALYRGFLTDYAGVNADDVFSLAQRMRPQANARPTRIASSY